MLNVNKQKKRAPYYSARILELPPTVESVTVPNPDGTIDVYINARLPKHRQRKLLAAAMATGGC